MKDCSNSFKKAVQSSITTCTNLTLQTSTRIKRFIIESLAILTVIAGNRVFSNKDNHLSNENNEAIRAAVNNQGSYLKKAHDFHNETRQTVHGLNQNLEVMESQLDFLGKKTDALENILALIREYEICFKDIEQMLRDIDLAAANGQASDSFLKLSKEKLWKIPIARWSKLQKCRTNFEGDDFALNYDFHMPKKNLHGVVFEAKSFNIWNQTEIWPLRITGSKTIQSPVIHAIRTTQNSRFRPNFMYQRTATKTIRHPKSKLRSTFLTINP